MTPLAGPQMSRNIRTVVSLALSLAAPVHVRQPARRGGSTAVDDGVHGVRCLSSHFQVRGHAAAHDPRADEEMQR